MSTLPYAISKWSDNFECGKLKVRRTKLPVKSDSESAISRVKTPPPEPRRKLSLLDERREIFNRRRFDTSEDSSADTVVPASAESASEDLTSSIANPRRSARQISVRKFDTFSTFEGTFDEDTGLGYLQGIEEDYSENFDQQEIVALLKLRKMNTASTVTDNMDKSRSTSQDSAVRLILGLINLSIIVIENFNK